MKIPKYQIVSRSQSLVSIYQLLKRLIYQLTLTDKCKTQYIFIFIDKCVFNQRKNGFFSKWFQFHAY